MAFLRKLSIASILLLQLVHGQPQLVSFYASPTTVKRGDNITFRGVWLNDTLNSAEVWYQTSFNVVTGIAMSNNNSNSTHVVLDSGLVTVGASKCATTNASLTLIYRYPGATGLEFQKFVNEAELEASGFTARFLVLECDEQEEEEGTQKAKSAAASNRGVYGHFVFIILLLGVSATMMSC